MRTLPAALRASIPVFLALLAAPLAAQPIQTIAGGGSNDGQPATTVGLYAATGLAVDAAGNVYIAEDASNRVSRIDAATGLVRNVAGNGGGGSGGDGGPATSATIRTPLGLAIDKAGNVYVSSNGEGRVRRIDAATGQIRTVAGGGSPQDGVGDGGPATSAGLGSPNGLALDKDGNLYVTDTAYNQHRVRKVTLSTGLIETVAGNGTQGFSGDGGPATQAALDSPYGLALDPAGNLYIADAGNNRIRRVDAATRTITTIAGTGSFEPPIGDGGPATQATFRVPSFLAFDASGRYLHVADRYHGRIRRIDTVTGTITTVFGDGSYGGGDGKPAVEAGLRAPYGLAFDAAGNLYVSDGDVRKVDAATTLVSTVAGAGKYLGDGGPATRAILREPRGIALGTDGTFYVADYIDQRVRKVSQGVVSTAAGNGGYYFDTAASLPATEAAIGFPRGVALDAAKNLYIVDGFNGMVFKVDAASGKIARIAGGGTPEDKLGDGGPATSAQLNYPVAASVAANGVVYIADRDNQRIRRVALDGTISTVAGSGPVGNENGAFSGDGGPATSARLNVPSGVLAMPDGTVIITDSGNGRLRMVAANGTIATIAGGGDPTDGFGDGGTATLARLNGPIGNAALDAAGNLLIADAHRVRRISASTGVIGTVAGSGNPYYQEGFSGDGGTATAAKLNGPGSVAVGSDGSIFIADSFNHRIRRVAIGGCALPTITQQPASPIVLTGTAAVLEVAAIAGTGTLRYQWYEGASGDTGRPVAGAASYSLTTPPLSVTTGYWVRVSDGCGATDSFTATVTVTDRLADLRLSSTASPDPVIPGQRITYVLTARNNGPTTATGAVVADTLPAGLTLVSATSGQGSCTGTAPILCALGTLVPGQDVTLSIAATVTAGAAPQITNRARISALEPDPSLDDNSAASTTRVAPPGSADLGVFQSASPSPARATRLLTYTLFIQNNGPAPATNVTLTETLPAGVSPISVTPSLGTCTGTAPITCGLGTIPAGTSRTVTLFVSAPPEPTTLVNRVSVKATEPDPNPTNDQSVLDTVVLPNVAACPPSPPDVVSAPEGLVRAGDSFTVSWTDVYGPTDADGTYRTQLASSADFGAGSILTEIRTRNLALSYPTAATTNGTLFFRVSAIAGCGQESGFSRVVPINVAPNPPSLVVSQEAEPAWTVRVGELPPAATVRFRNVGGSSASVTFRTPDSIFTFSPSSANLAAGQEVTVTLNTLPAAVGSAGTKRGSLVADYPQGSASAEVFLTVTGTRSTGIRPRLDQDELLIVDARTAGRVPLAAPIQTVRVTNPGSSPIFLVPSIGPGGAWLRLDPADFAAELAPGASRDIRLSADPSRITPADYPLPIWTVLSLTPAGGDGGDLAQVKVFYSLENDVVVGNGRGFLAPGEASFIVPTSVHKEGAGGTVFTSDGWLRNLSPDPVSFDVYASPSGQDGQVSATKVTQAIPGFATVRLYDFIQGLFGTTDLAAHVEIRSKSFAQLSLRTTASGLPGTGDVSSRYGTEIPVYGSGSGTGAGLSPLLLTGIKVSDRFRLNIILAETLGTAARVRLRLVGSDGADLGSAEVDVPASGNTQFPLLERLGVSGAVEAASLLVEPISGGGRVTAIGTLIDNFSASFQALSGRFRPAETTATRVPAAPLATPPSPRVIPSIVHSRGGSGTFFTTELSVTNGSASPAALTFIYDYVGDVSGTARVSLTLPPRGSLPAAKGQDVVKNLFGLPDDVNTAGPLRIEGEGIGRVVARASVTTPVEVGNPSRGTKGAEFQSYTAFSPEAVGKARTPVTTYPGLQKYAGIRTNLILAEVSGQKARVRLRVVNGTTGGVLAEIERLLDPWQRVQINDIWNGEGGFGIGSASIDRVAMSLEPIGDEPGFVVGALTVIDNSTASPRVLVLAPPGPPQQASLGF